MPIQSHNVAMEDTNREIKSSRILLETPSNGIPAYTKEEVEVVIDEKEDVEESAELEI